MSNQEYFSPSIVIKKDGDKIRAVSFPPLPNNTPNNMVDNIKDAVFRSMFYSSKFANKCEFSNNYYKLGTQERDGLRTIFLKGSQQLSNHPCFGSIQYHTDYKDYIKYANMYFECDRKILQNHNWCNKNVNIQRSNGQIFPTTIFTYSIIRFLSDCIMFYVKFEENNEPQYKWVPLTDYTSMKTGRKTTGLLNLNENLVNEELVLYIGEHPEWMNTDRMELIEFYTTELNKVVENYPDFKYRFSNENKYENKYE